MRDNRMLWAIGSFVIGLLQAWDSNAFQAGTLGGFLSVLAIAAPAVAIAATGRFAVRMTTLVIAAVLLAWVRVSTPVSTNALHLALFVPAVYILFVRRLTMPERQTAG